MTVANDVNVAKQAFLGEAERLAFGLSTTPDERLNWSPSTTARTPLAIVAHAAFVVDCIRRTLDGDMFSIPTTAETDRSFREFERDFTTREHALELLEQNSAAYAAWLEALPPSRLNDIVKMPFSLGEVPMHLAVTLPAQHTRWHAAQLDYLQTIYGDHDWYVGR